MHGSTADAAATLTKVTDISGFQRLADEDLLDISKENWTTWERTFMNRARAVALARYLDSRIQRDGLSDEDIAIFDWNDEFAKSILFDAVSKTEHPHIDDTRTAAEQFADLKTRHLNMSPMRVAALLSGIFTPVFHPGTSPAEVIATIHGKARAVFDADAMPKTADDLAFMGALHALGPNYPVMQRRFYTEPATGSMKLEMIEEAINNVALAQAANATSLGGKEYDVRDKLLSRCDCNSHYLPADSNCREPGAGKFERSSASSSGGGGGWSELHPPSPQILGGPDYQPVDTNGQQLDMLTEVSPQFVEREVRSLLNKLTMEKFDAISDQIIDWVNMSRTQTDGRTLIQVIRLIFEKATDEAAWSEMYARLCRKMMEQISTEIQDEGIKNAEGNPIVGGQLFRKYLLNRCQEDFERGWALKDAAASAGAARPNEDGAVRTAASSYYTSLKARLRGLGLVKFISELFKVQMLTERIMHECVKKLLGDVDNPEEEEIESLCMLLTTVGKLLDTARAGPHMDIYFTRMKELTQNPKVNSRMQFMLVVRTLSIHLFIRFA
jgi:hypothetical protein